MESVWSVSKLSTETVGSRRQLVHTADATKLDSFVASASAVLLDFRLQRFIVAPTAEAVSQP